MAWYDEAVFYHIYPLGLADAPKQNQYQEPEHRLNDLTPWISHIKDIGCNALYIGPLFESVGHGYETTDYKKVDSRLGTNEDLRNFVQECHNQGIRVILDGVFNHTGRDFFAFQDIKQNREHSRYRDWYRNVNFWGNNQFNDGFSYENWGGYDLLAKLNQQNPEVKDYIADVIRFWVSEYDVDGIRLDAADVLDFQYMESLRRVANEVKPDFWLMGEVIHGDYNRWVNEGTLHCVTNYHLHKALFSGHNDHNYFEIAHTVRRLYGMGGNRPGGLKLYNFVDNHDVERIYTKLNNKAHFMPVHILLYTLPGIPSIYYGSEFGIEGRKERWSDDSLRPALSYEDYKDAVNSNPLTQLIAKLGRLRQVSQALSYGDYHELMLTNRQYAYSRNHNGESVIVAVNNDDYDSGMSLEANNAAEFIGLLSGERVPVQGGRINVNVRANSGEIWVPVSLYEKAVNLSGGFEDLKAAAPAAASEPHAQTPAAAAAEQVSATVSGANPQEDAIRTEDQQWDAAPKAVRVPTNKPPRRTVEIPGEAPAPEMPAAELVQTAPASAPSETEIPGAETAPVGPAPSPAQAAPGETAVPDAQVSEPVVTMDAAPQAAVKTETAVADAAVPASDAPLSEDSPVYKEIFEKGRIAGLQEAILAIMSKNGPVTDQMRKDVLDNVYPSSLITWVKSFR